MIPLFNLKTIQTKLSQARKWNMEEAIRFLRQGTAPVPITPMGRYPQAWYSRREYIVRVRADILWTPMFPQDHVKPPESLPDAVALWANTVMRNCNVLHHSEWTWDEDSGSPHQTDWLPQSSPFHPEDYLTVPEWTFHGVGILSAEETQQVLDALQDTEEYQHEYQFMGGNYRLFLYLPGGEERVEEFDYLAEQFGSEAER
jgi:hypothetical protein